MQPTWTKCKASIWKNISKQNSTSEPQTCKGGMWRTFFKRNSKPSTKPMQPPMLSKNPFKQQTCIDAYRSHTCVHGSVYTCIDIHIWKWVHACMYKNACTYMNTHMHTHTWIHPCSTHTHTYIHQHIHKCMCALCIPYIACVCTLQLLVCDHIPWQRHTYTPMHAQVPSTTKVCTKARSTPDHLKMARWTPLSSCSNIDAMHQPTPRQKKAQAAGLSIPLLKMLPTQPAPTNLSIKGEIPQTKTLPQLRLLVFLYLLLVLLMLLCFFFLSLSCFLLCCMLDQNKH